MKIAQVAPLAESVPPRYYGGTERVVAYLVEELVALGHDVTLFASGDSRTSARLRPVVAQALRLSNDCVDPLAHSILMLEQVFACRHEFDVIHFHVDYLHFPLSRRIPVAQLTTLHGRLDIPDLPPIFREFREMPVVSISHSQRQPLAFANWAGTVYNGVPAQLLPFNPRGGDYLAFLGRISPEKRVDRAIEIAGRAGMPLRIAAKVDPADRDYFEAHIRHLLALPHVEYLGEIGETDKAEFLGNAAGLLFPIDWPEPFGLVMAEAMACGTPVIAYRHGSVPEIVDHRVNGFIVTDIADAVEAVAQLSTIDRAACRATFETRFSARRMALDYLTLYENCLTTDQDVAGIPA